MKFTRKPSSEMKIRIGMLVCFTILSLSSFALREDYRPIPYRIDGKWGFSDYTGTIVIPVQYDDVSEFTPWYDSSPQYFLKIPVAKVYKDGYVGYIDTNGTEILPPTKYHSISDSDPTYILVNEAEENEEDIPEDLGILMVEVNKKYGFISNGEFAVEPQFDQIISFNPYKDYARRYDAIVVGRKGEIWYRIQLNHPIEAYDGAVKEDVYGVCSNSSDIRGQFLPYEFYPPLDKDLESMELDSVARFSVIKTKQERPGDLYRFEMVFEVYRHGKVGLSREVHLRQGIVDIEPVYDSLWEVYFNNESDQQKSDISGDYITFLFEKEGSFGMVDLDGRERIPFRMKNIKYLDWLHYVLAYSLDGMPSIYFGFYDKIVSSPEYIHVHCQDEIADSRLVKVTTKDSWGYINCDGFEYWE